MVGNSNEGTTNWQVYVGEANKLGCIFPCQNETITWVRAFIRNDPYWAMSNPTVQAFIYQNNVLLGISNPVTLPFTGSTSYSRVQFDFPSLIQLQAGFVILGLYVTGYGLVEWNCGLAQEVLAWSFRDEPPLDDVWDATGAYELWKLFSIYTDSGSWVPPTDPYPYLISDGDILCDFSDLRDFEIGVENAANFVRFDLNTVQSGYAKTWSYGGWSNIALQQALGGGLFDYLNFAPVTVNDLIWAMLELKAPDANVSDDTRRLEVFRVHAPEVRTKKIECDILIPLGFDVGAWTSTIRLSRELLFADPRYFNPAWLNIGVSLLPEFSTPTESYPVVTVNHFTGTGVDFRRWDEKFSVPIKFGVPFHFKGEVYRDPTLGIIRCWIDNVLACNVVGSVIEPVKTLYVTDSVLNEVTPYNSGDGHYGFVALGLGNYKEGNVPSHYYIRNVKLSFSIQNTLDPPNNEPPVFTCPICSLTFSSQAELDAHIASAHPIQQNPCIIRSATQGTMFAGIMPLLRVFRDNQLPKRASNEYYAISRYVAPVIDKFRARLKI